MKLWLANLVLLLVALLALCSLFWMAGSMTSTRPMPADGVEDARPWEVP